MWTVNKDVDKMQEIGDKRHKRKNRSNFHYDGETRAKIGRFTAEKWTCVCQQANIFSRLGMWNFCLSVYIFFIICGFQSLSLSFITE